jgi:hypothetical protein
MLLDCDNAAQGMSLRIPSLAMRAEQLDLGKEKFHDIIVAL